MGQPPKPGVDWVAARAEFEAGKAGPADIAAKYGVSRQAVHQRIARQRWDAMRYEIEKIDISPTTWGNRTEAQAIQAIEYARKNLPYRSIAALIGMSEDAFAVWRKEIPEFEAALDRAFEQWHADTVDGIDEAHQRGDWRAGAYRLERGQKTRDLYGQQQQSGGPGLTIQIGFGRDLQNAVSTGRADEAIVIDAKPIINGQDKAE